MRWHITWYEGLGCFKNSGKEKSGDDFSGKKSEKKSGKRFSGKGVGVAVQLKLAQVPVPLLGVEQ